MTANTCDHESDDRRRAYRCPVAGPRASAVLRLGTREVAAEIVDESANGFAVVVDENVRSETGQTFSLGTADGWVEVEVKNIQFQQWTSFEEGGEPVTKTRTRLGLLRLRDLAVWAPDVTLWQRLSIAGVRKLLGVMRPLTQSFSRAAALVLGIALVGLGLVWGLEQTKIVEHKPLKELAPPAKIKEVPRPAPAKYVKQELPKLPDFKLKLPQLGKAELPKLSIDAASDEVLRMLSKPEVLFDPDIVTRLVLSQPQLQELEAIYQKSWSGVEGVGGSEAEQSARREIELASKSLAVLTESQQRSLLNILADLRAAETRKPGATAGSTSPVSETRTGER
jgi:hypothetical protein